MTEEKRKKPGIRHWLSVIPGTKKDYFLLSIAAVDVFFLMFGSSYLVHLPEVVSLAILLFDYFVIAAWGLHVLFQMRKQQNKMEYIFAHWYEIVGLVPLGPLRLFLLARGLKLAILYYKLGSSGKDVEEFKRQELSFRFRDVIIDTLADVVFKQSLIRVEEVMLRLDYNKLANVVLDKHGPDLKKSISHNIEQNTVIGDLGMIPLMGPVVRGIGNSTADTVIEMMRERVLGEVFHDITASILSDMHTSLKELDLVRITDTDEYQLVNTLSQSQRQNAESSESDEPAENPTN